MIRRLAIVLAICAGIASATPAVAQAAPPDLPRSAAIFAGESGSFCRYWHWDFGWLPCDSKLVPEKYRQD